MWTFFWLSVFAIALLLTKAYLRCRSKRPVRMWRRALFFTSLAFFCLLLAVSWRVNRSAAFVPDQASIASGEQLFVSDGCSSCHSVGRGRFFGPDLMNVSEKYDRDILMLWMTNSNAVYNEFGKRPLAEGNPEMPDIGVSEHDAELISAYLISMKQQPPK